MKNFFIFSAILFSLNLIADDRLYIFGGGGEPTNKDKTNFDQSLENLSLYSRNTTVTPFVFFNGGHKNLDKIRNENFPSTSEKGNFTAKNYDSALNSLLDDIKNNKIRSGQQVMIVIHSHGEDPQNSDPNSSTHFIATNETRINGTTFYDPKVDTKELQKIIDAAAAANIKLGIIDNSCFSGNTLKLKAPKACLISASGTDNYAIAANPYKDSPDSPLKNQKVFSDEFSSQLASHKFKNLEELYLNSRKNSIGTDFPSINTNAGNKNYESLYRGIIDYLKVQADNINMLDDVFKKLDTVEKICQFNLDFNNYLKTIDKLKANVDSTLSHSHDKFSKLKNDLKKYHELISNQALANINLKKYLKKSEYQFSGTNFNLREYLAIDTDLNIKKLTENLNLELNTPGITEEQKNITRNDFTLQINKFKKLEIDRQKLISNSSELQQAFKAIQDWNKDVDKNAGLAIQIGDDARQVYDELYKAQNPKIDAKNPCSEFKL